MQKICADFIDHTEKQMRHRSNSLSSLPYSELHRLARLCTRSVDHRELLVGKGGRKGGGGEGGESNSSSPSFRVVATSAVLISCFGSHSFSSRSFRIDPFISDNNFKFH